ncbi:MAG: hypothetical protein IPH94_12315 [Saprospiraceae bacterium]|nr:hypothetical protein [Saprospiraceae bacterium]
MQAYKERPVRFVEVFQHREWQIKLYSISIHNERVADKNIILAKTKLDDWLEKCREYNLKSYQIATLIIHEGREGCFAIISWWIDENMLQLFVYLKVEGSEEFVLFSDRGMVSCVWEMAVLWHERNAWVKHVLKCNEPDWDAYLGDHININT